MFWENYMIFTTVMLKFSWKTFENIIAAAVRLWLPLAEHVGQSLLSVIPLNKSRSSTLFSPGLVSYVCWFLEEQHLGDVTVGFQWHLGWLWYAQARHGPHGEHPGQTSPEGLSALPHPPHSSACEWLSLTSQWVSSNTLCPPPRATSLNTGGHRGPSLVCISTSSITLK